MDEAVSSSNFLEKNTLRGILQKSDVVPGHGSLSPEEISEKVVLKILISTPDC